jgi:hypothetical protein
LRREGAIFSVATPAEHRRHGYGAAITSFATRSLFERGADLAWLQTSPMGEQVYYRLGFRQVANHIQLSRPNPHREWFSSGEGNEVRTLCLGGTGWRRS